MNNELGKIVSKEPRNYMGMTEQEMMEASQERLKQLQLKIILELNEKFDLSILHLQEQGQIDIIGMLCSAISSAHLQGMLDAENIWTLKHFYDENIAPKKKEKPKNRTYEYEFELNKGIGGILLSNGTFIKCGHAEHYLIVDQVSKEEENKCLFLSSTFSLYGDNGTVYGSYDFEGVTDHQKKWMEFHYKYLDRYQKKMVCDLFDKYNWEE